MKTIYSISVEQVARFILLIMNQKNRLKWQTPYKYENTNYQSYYQTKRNLPQYFTHCDTNENINFRFKVKEIQELVKSRNREIGQLHNLRVFLKCLFFKILYFQVVTYSHSSALHPHFLQHLRSFFHIQGSFNSIGRYITIILKKKGQFRLSKSER